MFDKVFILILICFTVTALTNESCEHVKNHRNSHLLPAENKCGQRYHQGITYRNTGRTAIHGQFPWMVQLVRKHRYYPKTLCEGSIISSRYIVTAASCVKNMDPNNTCVILGNLKTIVSTYPEKFIGTSIEEIIRNKEHHNYEPHNAIALIRVVKEIHFDKFIKPICLPTPCSLVSKNLTGVALKTIGLEYPKIYKKWILQRESLQSSTVKVCEERLLSEPNPQENISTHTSICVRGTGGEYPCQNYAGGSLVYAKYKGYVNLLVGVLSSHQTCDRQHVITTPTPVVYTRVSSFVPWILDHMRD